MLHDKEKYGGAAVESSGKGKPRRTGCYSPRHKIYVTIPAPQRCLVRPELKWSTTDLLTDVKCQVDSSVVGLSVK